MSVLLFNETATPYNYTLSLHFSFPICPRRRRGAAVGNGFHVDGSGVTAVLPQAGGRAARLRGDPGPPRPEDRKSTRLNSHANISYAVFCLNKKQHSISLRRTGTQIVEL